MKTGPDLVVVFESMFEANIYGFKVRVTDLGFEIRQYHLRCSAMHGQAPSSGDLYHRDLSLV